MITLQRDESTPENCRLTKGDWKCLANIIHVLEPFKEDHTISGITRFLRMVTKTSRSGGMRHMWIIDMITSLPGV
jgi:hypothetical protein